MFQQTVMCVSLISLAVAAGASFAQDAVLKGKRVSEMPVLTGLHAPALIAYENASKKVTELEKNIATLRLAGEEVDAGLRQQLIDWSLKRNGSELAIDHLVELKEMEKAFRELEAGSGELWHTKVPDRFENLASDALVAIQALMQANSQGRHKDVAGESGRVAGFLMKMEFCFEDAEMESEMLEQKEELMEFMQVDEVKTAVEESNKILEEVKAAREKMREQQLRQLEAESRMQAIEKDNAGTASSLEGMEGQIDKLLQKLDESIESAWDAVERAEVEDEADD